MISSADLERLQAPTLARLREVLESADYRPDRVAELLGDAAYSALGREETTPARRVTRGGSALETLVRLWWLGLPVPGDEARRALPGGLADLLLATGLLRADAADHVVGTVELRPHVGQRVWWLLADRRPFVDGTSSPPAADLVLGPSPAATSLAGLTSRRPVDRALDLGTGCGVQALDLATHCGAVMATDVSRRSVAMARANAELNQVDLDVRRGDLFDPVGPVGTAQFDLVVSNPPFVVAPPGHGDLVYRDSGLGADEMVRRVVTGATRRLAPGGVAQVLGNWLHRVDEPWQERVAAWLDDGPEGVDGWVVQREVADPARYVELWLRDSGAERRPDYVRRYDEWLDWFEREGVTGVGMGWIVARRSGHRVPSRSFEDWPHAVEQPVATAVDSWLEDVELLRAMSDAEVLATAWRVRPDVREETVGAPGRADPEVIVLRQQRGMRRARRVDTVQAALVGACEGDLSAAAILGAVSQLLEQPIDPLERVGDIRELVTEGYLTLRR